MRKAFIAFDKGDNGDRLSNVVCQLFEGAGIDISGVFSISKTDGVAFKKLLTFLKDNSDCIIMTAGLFNTFDTKEIISQTLNVTFTENKTAQQHSLVGEYGEELFLCPEDSTVIPNKLGVFQGYMLQSDITLIVISDVYAEGLEMLRNYLIPYLSTKSGEKLSKKVFKLFGTPAPFIDGIVSRFNNDYGEKIKLTVTNNYGDTLLEVIYDLDDEDICNTALMDLQNTLSQYIYATEDITLAQTLVQLLTVTGKKIATAESFTGGLVASSIVTVSGASSVFERGFITYSNDAKADILGVDRGILDTKGAVCEDTAYEMAVGLLNQTTADVVIATTGLAGPNSDGTNKPVGLCYVAVGSKEGIYVYKYNFVGDRNKIIQLGVNTSLFKAIKLIKN